MPERYTRPPVSSGKFSSRVSKPIGGNRHAGPFEELPMGQAAAARNYFQYFNDFTSHSDFDVSTFEWNRTDGSASAYAAGTAIARVPDWTVATINSPTGVAVAPSLTAALLLTDAPYGVLRVSAGTGDSSGSRISRATAGANLSEIMYLSSTSDTITAGEFRFRYTETGTATQGAFVIGWHMDDGATLNSNGVALAGTIDQFGFYKFVGSSSLIAYTRAAADTTNLLTVGTITSGTWYTVGWRAQAISTGANNSFVDVWLDGTFIGTTIAASGSSDLTTGAYAPMAAIVNGVGADCTLDIDYISALSPRESVA